MPAAKSHSNLYVYISMSNLTHMKSLIIYCRYLLKKVECLRAAVELTRRLLTQCGQGVIPSTVPVQHTVYSLQVI